MICFYRLGPIRVYHSLGAREVIIEANIEGRRFKHIGQLIGNADIEQVIYIGVSVDFKVFVPRKVEGRSSFSFVYLFSLE